MRYPLSSLLALVISLSTATAADQAWQLRGEFGGLAPDNPSVVLLRVVGGRTIEVPLEAFSDADRVVIRKATEASGLAEKKRTEGGVTVRGPHGRSMRLGVPETIKDVEVDALSCRSADEAAKVYQLYLASDERSSEQREAATVRLQEWMELAEKGMVRLGDRWVSTGDAQAAAAEAEKTLRHALELMRLGNGERAEEELRKASRICPESARANFVMGLCYALVAPQKNTVRAADHFAKAVEHFTEVVRREPDNAAALNNLALAEILSRRFATAVEHFRGAVEGASDPRPVVDNIAWAVKSAGEAQANPTLARNRMPEKVVEDLNVLYRVLIQERKVKPAEGGREPRFLGPGGTPCGAAAGADVAKLFEADEATVNTMRYALGFVVAPGYVLCPAALVLPGYSISVGEREEPSTRLPAEVVAVLSEEGVAILRCPGLDVGSLAPSSTVPDIDSEVMAVGASAHGPASPWKYETGCVIAPPGSIAGAKWFVHSAPVPRGVGGGPIMDAAGRVIGMVAPTPPTHSIGFDRGFGIPIESLWVFIREHIPDLEPAEQAAPIGWPEVSRRAKSITVLIRSEPDEKRVGG